MSSEFSVWEKALLVVATIVVLTGIGFIIESSSTADEIIQTNSSPKKKKTLLTPAQKLEKISEKLVALSRTITKLKTEVNEHSSDEETNSSSHWRLAKKVSKTCTEVEESLMQSPACL